MNIVYLLRHTYEYGEELEHETTKELGVYSSLEKAREAKKRYFLLEGFRKYPEECFFICEYQLDKDSEWTEGFVSTDEIARDFEYLTECFNEWLGKQEAVEESWDDDNYYNALCEVSPKVYSAKDITELSEHIFHVWSVRFHNSAKTLEDCYKVAKKIYDKLVIGESAQQKV